MRDWCATFIQLTICAPNIPSTIVSWFIDTILPLVSEGETSAIYIGESPDAMPMATPPINRAIRNGVKLSTAPVIYAEIRNINAENTSYGLLPKRSAKNPETIAPIRHPAIAILIAKPCRVGWSDIPKYAS